MHVSRSQEHLDIACQILQRSVPDGLSYRKKTSGHFFLFRDTR